MIMTARTRGAVDGNVRGGLLVKAASQSLQVQVMMPSVK